MHILKFTLHGPVNILIRCFFALRSKKFINYIRDINVSNTVNISLFTNKTSSNL